MNGYEELEVSSNHALAQTFLPVLRRDPFDRILVAQAINERITLLTADEQVLRYSGPIQSV